MKFKFKRAISFALALILMFSGLSVLSIAKVNLPTISKSKPIITYTYNSSGKVYAYTAADLKTKTGGYIACATDQNKIIEIKNNAVKVIYPVSGGTKTAWFSRDAFTYRDLYNDGAKLKFTAKASVDTYRWKNNSTKLGSISKGDVCYLLRGDESSDWLQLIYPVSGGHKMGWIKVGDYKKILPVAEGITLNKSSVTLYGVGSTASLSANVTPNTAIDKSVKWSTSNASIAAVSSSGYVTAKGYGSATITAQTVTGKTAKCTINVLPIDVTGISLNSSAISLTGVGSTYALTATVYPSNATNKNVTWYSSDSSVATVSSSGLVTAFGAGTATISAITNNGKSASCTVSVYIVTDETSVDVESVYLNTNNIVLYGVGSMSYLTASVYPSNAENKTITWYSSNTSVASVDSFGNIKANGIGTATITATSYNGITATCNVTVSPLSASSVSLNTYSYTLNGKGKTVVLKATVNPSNTTDKSITWSSSNKSVATVSSSGEVKAVDNGSAIITAKTSNGKTATCTITVASVSATSVKLNKSSLSLSSGETYNLKATISPSNSTDEITWSTSNKSVATVSSSGKVTAKGAGTATITAKATGGKKATVKVTCKGFVSTSEIDKAAEKYNISKSSNAYKALKSINTKYNDKLTDSQKNGVLVFMFEGVGSSSSATKRMNAMCVVVKNRKIKYINRNSSTIPDYPFSPSKNGGDPMPTLKSGIYSFSTKNHKGSYAALNVNGAKVVRFKSKSSFYNSTSSAINVHRRSSNSIPAANKGWVNSAGCLIVGKTGTSSNSEYAKFIQTIGIVGSTSGGTAKFTKKVNGKIIVDRTYAESYLSAVGYSSSAIKAIG